MALGKEVGLVSDHIMLDGTQLPSPKRADPQFSAHFYCGETAGCIKMPLGMEVGLSPGDFVLDGDPAPYPKGAEPSNFRTTSIVAKRLHGSRRHYGGRPRPARHCAIWGPSSTSPKGAQAANFQPMSVVAKRLDEL